MQLMMVAATRQEPEIAQRSGSATVYRSLVLDNGLRVVLVQDSTSPKAECILAIASGMHDDPVGYPGLHSALGSMLSNIFTGLLGVPGGTYSKHIGPDTWYSGSVLPSRISKQ